MGKRKHRIIFLGLGLLLLLFIGYLSVIKKSLKINSCAINKDKIVINLKCKNFIPNIGEVTIESNDEYHVFDNEDICCKKINDYIEVTLNCYNKKIKTNQRYDLSLHFSGGRTKFKIFIGNPIEKIEDFFPCGDNEHIRIIILSTPSSLIGI